MLRVVGAIGRGLYRWVPIALPFVVVGVFVVRGYSTPDFPQLTAPAGVTLPPTTSTLPDADLTGVQLPPVNGTTTSVPLRTTGHAQLSGTVEGPDGLVGGAIVRVERIGIDDSTDAVAGPSGRWALNGISGGRYRARAFLPPRYAQTEDEVFFLAENEQKSLALTVDRFSGLTITSNNAPDPPEVGDPTNVVVRVLNRVVDSDGIVRSDSVAGATVTITSSPGFSVRGSTTATTSGSGDAVFTVQCTASGADQLDVAVQVDPLGPAQPFAVTTSACVSRAPPPPPSTSSSSSSSPPPSSSSSG